MVANFSKWLPTATLQQLLEDCEEEGHGNTYRKSTVVIICSARAQIKHPHLVVKQIHILASCAVQLW